MFHRMREIERVIGLLCKNLYVSFLDSTLEDEDAAVLSTKEKAMLLKKFEKNRGRGPKGFTLAMWIARSAIIAWIILIVIEILIYISPGVRLWLFDPKL